MCAFLDSFVLLLTALGITLVGLKQLLQPIPVDGGWIMAIRRPEFRSQSEVSHSCCGMGAQDDLNIRSAFWHMLGDAWASLGVVISGGGRPLFTGWTILDPLIQLAGRRGNCKGAWPLFKESLEVLLESTPPKISASRGCDHRGDPRGVKNVHDLHIWAVDLG